MNFSLTILVQLGQITEEVAELVQRLEDTQEELQRLPGFKGEIITNVMHRILTNNEDRPH